MTVTRTALSLSGEKGNTLVSQKRMQRYDIFFIYANFSLKNMHFLPFFAIFCQTNVAKRDKKGSSNALRLYKQNRRKR